MPLRQNNLRSPTGAQRPRKRIGRGNASGTGTYSGRGLKGQKSRSGKDLRVGFEGGQMPLIRKMPHRRGFTNARRVEYTPINLIALNRRFPAGAEVTAESLVQAGLLKSAEEPFKVLAGGELDHPLAVQAPKVSAAARAKIEAAGGSVKELDAARASSAESH